MSDATDTLIGLPAVAVNVERSVTHHSQHRGDHRGGGRGRGSVEVDTALLLLKLLLVLLLMLMLQLRTRYGQIGLVLGGPTQLVLLGEILVRLWGAERGRGACRMAGRKKGENECPVREPEKKRMP